MVVLLQICCTFSEQLFLKTRSLPIYIIGRARERKREREREREREKKRVRLRMKTNNFFKSHFFEIFGFFSDLC